MSFDRVEGYMCRSCRAFFTKPTKHLCNEITSLEEAPWAKATLEFGVDPAADDVYAHTEEKESGMKTLGDVK